MFIRKQEKPYESMKILFELAQAYAKKETPFSLIAAREILKTLHYENFPDKAFQGALGRVENKLDKLGLFEEILKYEQQSDKDEKGNIKTAAGIKSKL